MFESTHPFLLFDYFRVPYRVTGGDGDVASLAVAAAPAARPTLRWPTSDAAGAAPPALRWLGTTPFFGRVLREPALRARLDGKLEWTPVAHVHDRTGAEVAVVLRGSDGSIALPFDPNAVIAAYWSEAYTTAGAAAATRAKRMARAAYYRLRPVIPRAGQIRLRRFISRFQARSAFPRWPVETALHDLYSFLFDLAAAVAGAPVPRIASWPNGHTWALVLTHDVETAVGYERLEHLRALERPRGFRSAWNLVPRRYEVRDDVVRALVEDGCEVGVHGLYHDGRDLASRAILRERLPAIRDYAERWGAVGFRSPATRRVWELMPLLGFDYDSSYPDTDPFEPDGGGCCTWLPFFNGDLVELPITLPQDHTLFTILRHADEAAWVEKTSYLRRRGGMALLITHPDYTIEPRIATAYSRFLDAFAGDGTAWRALPCEVSAWWRRRAASSLELIDGAWTVVGDAAGDAAVELVGAPAPTAALA